MLTEKYRAVTKDCLETFLDTVRQSRISKDQEAIDILLPHIKNSLDDTRRSFNYDLAEKYAPLFRQEVPEYSF